MIDTPRPKLDHLRHMTDDTGLVQWALYTLPDPHSGYSIDDNARALVVSLMHYEQTHDAGSLDLARRYLAFLRYAQTPEGQFHNFLGFDRRWLDRIGSENSQGWAVWALCHAVASPVEAGTGQAARHLLQSALPWIESLEAPRAIAFCLLGLAALDESDSGLIFRLGQKLLNRFNATAGEGWDWFENEIVYCNGALPHALIAAAQGSGERRFAAAGRRALDFLVTVVFRDGMLDLVGNTGWWVRGSPRAEFDQQPVDAAGMVEVCLAAWRTFGETRYRDLAWTAFEWFHGRNRGRTSLVNELSGGCRDGLESGGINLNEGAESTLAYLYSDLLLRRYDPDGAGTRGS